MATTKKTFMKKPPKEAKLPKPKRMQTDDRSTVAASVCDGLREDLVKDEEAVIVSDFLLADPIVGWVSTNSFLLDCAIGYPKGAGLPLPAVVELVGSESTGKSSLGYAVLGNIQQAGGWSKLFDAEGMFTREYGVLAGLSLSKDVFGYSQIPRLESNLLGMRRAIERTYALASDMPFGAMLDSVAGCTTAAEQEPGEPARATHARILARALRSGLTNLLYTRVKTPQGDELLVGRPIILLFINQLKATMAPAYGPQLDSFGGKGLKYHSRVRLQLDRKAELHDKTKTESPHGFRCHVKILKNKVGSAKREVEFDFLYATGIEDYYPVIDFMEKWEALPRSGNRYEWKGKMYYASALRELLIEHPSEWEDMKQQCLVACERAWGSTSIAQPSTTLTVAE